MSNKDKSIKITLSRKGISATLSEIREVAEKLNIDLNTCNDNQRSQIVEHFVSNVSSIAEIAESKAVFNLKTTSEEIIFTNKFEQSSIVKQNLEQYDITVTDSEIFNVSNQLNNTYCSVLDMMADFLEKLNFTRLQANTEVMDKISNTIADMESREYKSAYDAITGVKNMNVRLTENRKKMAKAFYDNLVVSQGEKFVKMYRDENCNDEGKLYFED